MNPHLLQLLLTPTEYRTLMTRADAPFSADDSFWEHIPNYLIARCPICNAVCSAQLNTYDPRIGWNHPTNARYIYHEKRQTIGCSHFFAVQHFVNFYGDIPQESSDKSTFILYCEVPHVQPVFLPNDILSHAVIHALPICKIERTSFVPKYSAFIVTYFSEEPRELVRRRWEIAPEAHGAGLLIGSGYYLHKEKSAWDLVHWVQNKKLFWLEVAEADLPLRSGAPDLFPYRDVQGRREEQTYYRFGKPWPPSLRERLRIRLRREKN